MTKTTIMIEIDADLADIPTQTLRHIRTWGEALGRELYLPVSSIQIQRGDIGTFVWGRRLATIDGHIRLHPDEHTDSQEARAMKKQWILKIGPFVMAINITAKRGKRMDRGLRGMIDALLRQGKKVEAISAYRAYVCDDFVLARLYVDVRERVLVQRRDKRGRS